MQSRPGRGGLQRIAWLHKAASTPQPPRRGSVDLNDDPVPKGEHDKRGNDLEAVVSSIRRCWHSPNTASGRAFLSRHDRHFSLQCQIVLLPLFPYLRPGHICPPPYMVPREEYISLAQRPLTCLESQRALGHYY